jgi:hypothetical protein
VGCGHVSSNGFGDGSQDQHAQDVVVDANGDILVVGRFKGGINFGTTALSSAGGKYDVFVAKINGTTGAEIWARGFGDGTQDQHGEGIAVDSGGNVFVVGRFKGGINFGTTALTSAGNKYDVFVAKLDGANGNELRAANYGDGSQDAFAMDVAIDGNDDVVLTGDFEGTINFGTTTLTSAGARTDVFVTKLDGGNGNEVWARNFGDGTQDQHGTGIAVDSAGEVFVTGRFRGSINFGGGAHDSAGGKYDVFAAKLNDTDGAELWAHAFGDGTQDQHAEAIAIDAANNAVVVGRFKGAIDFGGGAMSSVSDKYDVFVAELSGADGTQLWAHGYGDGTQDQRAESVAVDTDGDVAVIGRFKGSIDFGGGAMTSAAGKFDVFVAKLNDAGAYLCASGYGDGSQDQHGMGVAFSAAGAVMGTGRFKGGIDFGGGTIASAGGKYDVFVATFSP